MSEQLILSKETESSYGLKIERFFNSKKNEVDLHFLFNNLIVKNVTLTGKIVNSYSGNCLIQKDITSACVWMEKAITLNKECVNGLSIGHDNDDIQYIEQNDPIIKALFVASLTFYGKAFTEAQGRGAQLKVDLISPEYRDFHLEIMRYRHHYAAHSGESKIEIAKTYVLLMPNQRNSLSPTLYTSRMQPNLLDPEHLLELFKHVLKVVEDRMSTSQKKIHNLILSKSHIFWESNAVANNAVNLDDIQNELNLQKQKRELLRKKRK